MKNLQQTVMAVSIFEQLYIWGHHRPPVTGPQRLPSVHLKLKNTDVFAHRLAIC